MQLVLAPMEGVADAIMRELLTELGALDLCVSEFIRVSNTLLPAHVFYKSCPELRNHGRTASGTPVRVQLLGHDAQLLAENAARACELGAPSLDLNFGCPAKAVTRHNGGAALLSDPEKMARIVSSVRRALPRQTHLSVKIRLGVERRDSCLELANAIESAGADSLIVHARSKADGYRPPAYWEWLPRIREQCRLPLMVNGEIWTVEDYWRCREISGCDQVMIGRGVLRNPFLPLEIRHSSPGQAATPTGWSACQQLLLRFFQRCLDQVNDRYTCDRVKQWLSQLRKQHVEAAALFEQLKRIEDIETFRAQLYAGVPAT